MRGISRLRNGHLFSGEIKNQIDNLRAPLLRTLAERGFIKDATDLAGLDQAIADRPVPAYIGFDLTASSLHVGSLIQLMVLRHIRAAAIAAGMSHAAASSIVNVVVGDATTKVGDPSDKNGARPVLTADAIGYSDLSVEPGSITNHPGTGSCS